MYKISLSLNNSIRRDFYVNRHMDLEDVGKVFFSVPEISDITIRDTANPILVLYTLRKNSETSPTGMPPQSGSKEYEESKNIIDSIIKELRMPVGLEARQYTSCIRLCAEFASSRFGVEYTKIPSELSQLMAEYLRDNCDTDSDVTRAATSLYTTAFREAIITLYNVNFVKGDDANET